MFFVKVLDISDPLKMLLDISKSLTKNYRIFTPTVLAIKLINCSWTSENQSIILKNFYPDCSDKETN